ncbi:MAG TPA: hypothetical protein PK156_16050 [Polyangium sp.]|nr:hypothetical protein [Polyangium sp.]
MLHPDRGAVPRTGISIGGAAVGLGAEKWRIFSRQRVDSLPIVLRRLAFSFVVSWLVCPRIVYAEDAEKDRAFAQFVREGDRARWAGRNPDAIAAYQKALDLRDDTRIRGRLGLVCLEGGAPVKAANNLLPAFLDISSIPPRERQAIKDGYERARSAVSRIKIDVSHLAADVFIDGNSVPLKRDANSFHIFATPGPHEIRATLAGHEDARDTVDSKKGGVVAVSLVLKLIPPPPPPPPAPPLIANEKRNGMTATTPKPSFLVKPSPWSVGAGVVALSGAISYVPATGVIAEVERRYGEWFSIRLDARAAWSPQYVTTRPLRGFTYAGLLGACATRTRYFGCGQAHLGAIGISLDTDKPYTWWNWRFGLGATAGVQLPINRVFQARFALDVLFFSGDTRILSGSYDKPSVLWSGPPVLGGFSVTLVWRPELRVLR